MNSTISYIFNGENHSLEIIKRISFSEEESLINEVVSALFDDNGVYCPSRFDYYFWSMILGKYTSFNFDDYSANEIYAIIDDSNIKKVLSEFISDSQLRRMQYSIDEMIQVRLNEHPLKGAMNAIQTIMLEGSDAFKKILSDESFRNQLTEYINNGDQATLIGALNNAAYKNE